MKMTTIGLDLAKNMFQLHGVDEAGPVVLKNNCKTRASFTVLRPVGTVSDWHGSLRRGAPLGEGIREIRTYGKAHGPAVRETLRENQQERRSGRRGDLRKPWTGRTCVSCRSRPANNRRCWRCIAPGKASSKHAPPRRTRCAACWLSTGSSSRRASIRLPNTRAGDSGGRRERSARVFRGLLLRLGEHLKTLDRQVDELET